MTRKLRAHECDINFLVLEKMFTQVQPEHPLQPQCIHSTMRPSSSLPFGTLQMQFVPKLVSLVCIHRKQQRFS